MDFPLFRTFRNKNGLQIVGRMRAWGKEKRVLAPIKDDDSSPVPFSRLSRRGLSAPARDLVKAKRGDEEAEARLHLHLAENIQRHAKHQDWKIGITEDSAMLMARIVLWPAIYEELQSDQKNADIADVRLNNYQKNWKGKLTDFGKWVSGWAKEAEGN